MKFILIVIGFLFCNVCFSQTNYDFKYAKKYRFGEQIFEDGITHIYDFVESDSTTLFMMFVCTSTKERNTPLISILDGRFTFFNEDVSNEIDLGVNGDVFEIRFDEQGDLNGFVFVPKGKEDELVLLFMFFDDGRRNYKLDEIRSLLQTFNVLD